MKQKILVGSAALILILGGCKGNNPSTSATNPITDETTLIENTSENLPTSIDSLSTSSVESISSDNTELINQQVFDSAISVIELNYTLEIVDEYGENSYLVSEQGNFSTSNAGTDFLHLAWYEDAYYQYIITGENSVEVDLEGYSLSLAEYNYYNIAETFNYSQFAFKGIDSNGLFHYTTEVSRIVELMADESDWLMMILMYGFDCVFELKINPETKEVSGVLSCWTDEDELSFLSDIVFTNVGTTVIPQLADVSVYGAGMTS